MDEITGKKLITASALVCDGPCHFFGYIINSADTDDYVDFYEGLDTGSGERFIHEHTRESYPHAVFFGRPVLCENGLYVALDDGIQNVTLFYNPIHSDGRAR